MPAERPGASARTLRRLLAAPLAGLLLLGGATAGALVLADDPAPDEVAATGVTAPDPRPARAPSVVPALAAAPPAEPAPQATVVGPDGQVLPSEVGVLRAGVHGARTFALQGALHDLGFDPGEADGTFDEAVTQAVWAFQALAGAPKDGVVDAALEARILAREPIAMLRPDLGPTHTEVDLTRQVLLVWGDGELELVTHVSTGAEEPYCLNGECGDAITPEGEFTYQYRIAGERHATLGVLHDPVYFDFDGHAVHGDPEVPDHPASHGCVRIPLHVSPRFPGLVADGEVIALFRS